MRVFSHASDYQVEFWRHLPALVLLSKPLILWAPTAGSLRKAFDTGASRVGPRKLLDLIEAGFIEIHAREQWYDPVHRKKMRFRDGDLWDSEFDGELLRRFRAHGSGFNNLFAHPLGGGDSWAEEQIASQSTTYLRALDFVQRGQVMQASLAKAASFAATEPGDVVRVLLRDAKNHMEALGLVGAGADVEPDPYWWTRSELCGDSSQFSMPSGEPLSFERISRLAQLIEELTGQSSFDDLIRLKEKFGEDLRRETWQLFADENDPMASQFVDLERVAKRKKWNELIVGANKVEAGSQLCGAFFSIVDVLLQGPGAIAVLGLAAAGVPVLKNVATNEGHWPIDTPKESVPLGVALAHRRLVPWFPYMRAPTLQEIREIVERLRKAASMQ